MKLWLISARNVILFGAMFFVTSQALRPATTEDRVLQAKRDHLSHAARADPSECELDQYEAIFFGSSRTYRAFSPPVFNQHLPPDRQLSIFNHGVGSTRPHELEAHLDWVLEHKPRRLRLVLIELMDWHPTILQDMQGIDRTPLWHSPSRTWRAFETSWLADMEWTSRVIAWNDDLVALLEHSTNYGQGARWWTGREEDKADHLRRVMEYADGFVAFDQEVADFYERRRRQFLERDLEIFHRQIGQVEESNRRPGDLTHFNRSALLRQQERLQRRGLQVIYVIPNLRWGTPDFYLLETQGVVEHLWRLNSPDRFPELYRAEHYFDRGHLNRDGAGHFSRRLAERYLQWLSEQSAEST